MDKNKKTLRQSLIERNTKETQVIAELNIDGTGEIEKITNKIKEIIKNS